MRHLVIKNAVAAMRTKIRAGVIIAYYTDYCYYITKRTLEIALPGYYYYQEYISYICFFSFNKLDAFNLLNFLEKCIGMQIILSCFT